MYINIYRFQIRNSLVCSGRLMRYLKTCLKRLIGLVETELMLYCIQLPCVVIEISIYSFCTNHVPIARFDERIGDHSNFPQNVWRMHRRMYWRSCILHNILKLFISNLETCAYWWLICKRNLILCNSKSIIIILIHIFCRLAFFICQNLFQFQFLHWKVHVRKIRLSGLQNVAMTSHNTREEGELNYVGWGWYFSFLSVLKM